jgi:hypothetical protein
MAGGLVGQLRWQAEACAALGSAFYAEILERLAVDAESGGVVSRVLAGHDDDPTNRLTPIRLLGGVHRRVLTGLEPALAAHYPTTGGDGDAAAAVPPILLTLQKNEKELRAGLAQSPQTNEVGRAAPLAGVLWHLQSIRALPVRLLEIGASAGLNLLVDRFRFEAAAGGTGPVGSAVVFEDVWHGTVPPIGELLAIVERRGCDPAPVDASTDEGALTLMSYVWPDQTERVARLRGALAIARETPVDVVRRDAAGFLADLAPVQGAWTVVWHSVMWMYLTDDERAAVSAHLERAGRAATNDAPVAHVSLEPRGLDPETGLAFHVAVRTWPPGDPEATIGYAPAHGVPVEWRL